MPRSERNQQRVRPGLGQQYVSPEKRSRHLRPSDKARVTPIGHSVRILSLQSKLQELLSPGQSTETPVPTSDALGSDSKCVSVETAHPLEEEHSDSITVPANGDGSIPENEDDPKVPKEEQSQSTKSTPRKRRLLPDEKAHTFFERFRSLLPELEKPYLEYIGRSAGKPVGNSFTFPPILCANPHICPRSMSRVTLLFWDHLETHDIPYCQCQPLAVLLVQNGMFPSGPLDPRMAVSIDLLDFYFALFERSGDAVTAMAGAIHKFYITRGWQTLSAKGESIRDPFRRGLGYAVQWYDMLRVSVERRVEQVIDSARLSVLAQQPSDLDVDGRSQTASPRGFPSSTQHPQTQGESQTGIDPKEHSSNDGGQRCTLILQKRCPACFGGRAFGRSLSQGGDIHVALDANFSHRHLRNAGDSPSFYDPTYFLPNEFVEKIDDRIVERRKKPPRRKWMPPVPDSAIDTCQHGHEAANEHKVKTDGLRFDDTGVMAMLCRHDIPLFLVNMDTPGERQKYAIALIEHLFSLIPSNATVGAHYDIGCVLHRSTQKFGLMADDILDRLYWVTSAMHAYGHAWACQLVYAPRFRSGSGDTDGEGVERLWSKMRSIIPVARTSARPKRLWLLDRTVMWIGESTYEDIGRNIRRRYRRTGKQQLKALEELGFCQVDESELRLQWELQRKEQTSLRNHAPARLKKDLDAVLTLHAEVEKLDKIISAAQKQMKHTHTDDTGLTELHRLQMMHLTLQAQVERLYASLKVDSLPPAWKTLPIEFLRLMVLARDMKTNLRIRFMAHSMEWDRLDQAVGGRDVPLGTKMHQETRKKIARRKPTIMTGLKSYNGYCVQLEAIRPAGCKVPIPSPLPLDLAALRDDPRLMEDVWIAQSPAVDPPRWLVDQNVRRGILAMHRNERSNEEKRRCKAEADNLCRWFGLELTALEVALRLEDNALYYHFIRKKREQHLLRRFSWHASLVPPSRYEHQLLAASQTADAMYGAQACQTEVHCEPCTALEDDLELADDEEDNEVYEPDGDHWERVQQMLLSDLVEDVLDDDFGGTFLPEDGMEPISEPADSSATAPGPTVDRSSGQFSALKSASRSLDPENVSDALRAVWIIPRYFRVDFFMELLAAKTPLHSAADLVQPRIGSYPWGKVSFSRSDLERLANPTACLNDICINDCAALLRETYGHPDHSYALFSTYDISYLRSGAYDRLRKAAHRTQYWKCDLWMLPLYQPSRMHWTLVVLVISQRTAYYFDSFADEPHWKAEVEEALNLFNVLCGEQDSAPRGPWSAYPLSTRPLQTNVYDCGLWVLASMAAIFRNFEVTGIWEGLMPAFRRFLLAMVLALPITHSS